MPAELETVASFWHAMDAEQARLVLESEGIAAFVAQDAAGAMLPANVIGSVGVQVAAADANRARGILAKDHQEALDRAGRPAREECLSCGAALPENMDKCPACGWSYVDEGAPDS